jgi:hypothetical protein
MSTIRAAVAGSLSMLRVHIFGRAGTRHDMHSLPWPRLRVLTDTVSDSESVTVRLRDIPLLVFQLLLDTLCPDEL